MLDVLKHGNGTAAWILVRSLLEAFVDLINIVDDPGYDEVMHASFLEQQKRRIGIAQKRGTTNPYLRSIVGNSTVLQHGQWIDAELASLKQKGVVPLNVKDRFERAKLLDLYDGPYSSMSQQTHSNLGALEERHIDVLPTGVTVTYFREITDDHAQMILDSAAGVLANSVSAVKSLLEGYPPKGLEGISEELRKLRALWKQGA
jgi:hypothetical protein